MLWKHWRIYGNEIADWLAKRGAKGASTSDPPPASILNEIRLHLPVPQPPTSEDALADSLGLSDEEEPEARPQPGHLDRTQDKPDQPGLPTPSLRRSGKARKPTTQSTLFPETTFNMYR